MDKKMMNKLAWWLVVVGALNWGLVGLLNVNLVEMVLGSWPVVEKLVYILVGASGVYLLATNKDMWKM